MYKVIRNGKTILKDKILTDCAVVIKDDVILEITDKLSNLNNCEDSYNANGNYIGPGFIDLHVHGGAGFDFLDATQNAFASIAEFNLKNGVTTIYPTLTTCSDKDLQACFSEYRKFSNSNVSKIKLGGLHLEGPFFSPLQVGAQDPENLILPTKENVENIIKNKDIIARVSAAPELEGAYYMGNMLRQNGIVAAIGHSDADFCEVEKAVQHNYTHVTHLYSGMSTIKRKNAYRHLGVVESAYIFDELSVEIIADGKHLPPELLKLIVKCKDNNKISLITDATRGAGMEEGAKIKLGNSLTGTTAIVNSGVAMMPDGLAFAGSVCTANKCVKNMVDLAGLDIISAVNMMSLNPACVMGINKNTGSIEPQKKADIIIFDDDINILDVFVDGEKKL